MGSNPAGVKDFSFFLVLISKRKRKRQTGLKPVFLVVSKFIHPELGTALNGCLQWFLVLSFDGNHCSQGTQHTLISQRQKKTRDTFGSNVNLKLQHISLFTSLLHLRCLIYEVSEVLLRLPLLSRN